VSSIIVLLIYDYSSSISEKLILNSNIMTCPTAMTTSIKKLKNTHMNVVYSQPPVWSFVKGNAKQTADLIQTN